MAKPNNRPVLRLLHGLALFLLLLSAAKAAESAQLLEGAASSRQANISCAPERPVVHPGESIKVNVWVTDSSGKALIKPPRYSWNASLGTIIGADTATWALGNPQFGSPSYLHATAKVEVQGSPLSDGTCEVQIFVAQQAKSAELTSLRAQSRNLQQQLEYLGNRQKQLEGKFSAHDTPANAESQAYEQRLLKLQEQLARLQKEDQRLERQLRSARLSGRGFLLPNGSEPTGYGLYSYLLFDTPPRDDFERARYLKALEALLLMLQPTGELEHYKRRSELNLLQILVRREVETSGDLNQPERAEKAAEQVLAAYDYARASTVLANLDRPPLQGGPFLVAMKPAATDSGTLYLFLDMSRVTPKLVWDWVRAFCSLAAQTPTWGEVGVTKLALNTRNAIAVAARDAPEVLGALQQWIRVLRLGEKG